MLLARDFQIPDPDLLMEYLPAPLYDEWLALYTIEHEEREQAAEVARMRGSMRR